MPRPADDAVAILTRDLSIARAGDDARVVEGVTIDLPRGGVLAVMGPTGAGKSTLAGFLASSDDPLRVAGGAATVLGLDARKAGRTRRLRSYLTGYLAQGAGAALPSRLTVSEVIASPITSRDRRVNRRALAVRVASLLDELELPLGAAAKYPYELSAGMRQRVALARSLVLDPRLFVGDEPYANLDPEVRHAAREALLRRRRDNGMAILIVTNDTDAITGLAADVLVLKSGHPVAYGPDTDDLLWTPDESAPIAG